MWTKCGFWSFRPQKGQVLWTKCRFRAFPERALQEIVSWKGFRDWKNVSSNLGRAHRAACGSASVIGNRSDPEAKPFSAKIDDYQRVSIHKRGDACRRHSQEILTGDAYRRHLPDTPTAPAIHLARRKFITCLLPTHYKFRACQVTPIWLHRASGFLL